MRLKAGRCRMLAALCLVLALLQGAAGAEEWQLFHMDAADARNSPALDYWVYVPDGDTEGLPLVVFLHGSGEKGDGALSLSLPQYIREGSVPPPEVLLVVPQLPAGLLNWAAAENTVIRITDEAASAFGADTSRLSLAGFSLGGMGVWNLNKIAPGKFTRSLCVCGSISTWVRPEQFAGCELKMCTGRQDGSVNAREERIYAEDARKKGLSVEWIEYPSGHFETSILVFTDMEILTWLRLYGEKEEAT